MSAAGKGRQVPTITRSSRISATRAATSPVCHSCLEREHAADRRPHVIALTANALDDDRQECLAAGMDDYLSKPLQRDKLEAALERAARI